VSFPYGKMLKISKRVLNKQCFTRVQTPEQKRIKWVVMGVKTPIWGLN